MIGKLPKSRDQFRKIPGARLPIICGMNHRQYVEAMVEKAREILYDLEVTRENLPVHWLPGGLELPHAARVLFEAEVQIDAILAFGVVLCGATTHDATVLQHVVHGFSLVSDRCGKPIINEVFGVTKLEDARVRSGNDDANKGIEAAFAVSELLHWKRTILKEENTP